MESTLSVERSIVIKADRQRVWQAITEAEQISQWFDSSMTWTFKPTVGTSIQFSMNQQVIGEGKIVAVEPPDRFVFRWTAEPGNPTLTLVTIRLETVAEGTRVTISESGFEALPEDVRQRRLNMNGEGWSIALDHLTAYLQAADHA